MFDYSILEVVRLCGLETVGSPSRKGEQKVKCPFVSGKTFDVNVTTSTYKCWHDCTGCPGNGKGGVLVYDDAWNEIKKYYPESKYIANAHDVLYLNSYGKYCLEKNSFIKFIRKRQYKLLKSKEENVIPKFDYVFTLNYCDKQIINEIGQKNVSVIAPYYDDYYLESKNRKKRIIFFGAMNRPDNYLSCIWFIENVFNKLNRKDVEFYIIGGNPHESLFKYGKKDNNIKITGFISYEEIKKILSESICMVVPLINGSGIKIKVLEGFSAGIPVLSNNVGMRGIPARNKMDYLHCEKAEDFIKSIEFLINNPREIEKIGKNGYCFLHEKFNKRKSAELFINIVKKVGYSE